MSDSLALIAGLVAGLCLLLAALADLRARLIPNRWPLAIVMAWCVAIAAVGTPSLLANGLAAGFAALCGGALLFQRGWLGGGDVKLFAATACWGGIAMLLPMFVLTSIAGAIVALLAVAAAPPPRRSAIVPYGVAIAASGLLVLGDLPWLFHA